MGDIDGPRIARTVYQELMKKDAIGMDDIPYALATAVDQLKREPGISPYRWAPYVHIGA
jgi:hypothetical protein